MSHRRICYCCETCIQFSDDFGRSELGDGWSIVSGSWSLSTDAGNNTVETSSANAQITSKTDQPDDKGIVIDLLVKLGAVGNVAKVILADSDSAIAATLTQTSSTTITIRAGSGTSKTVSRQPSLWSEVRVCWSGTGVAITCGGVTAGTSTEVPSGPVSASLGTGTVSSVPVRFAQYSQSLHADDLGGCPSCGAPAAACGFCQASEGEIAPFVKVTLRFTPYEGVNYEPDSGGHSCIQCGSCPDPSGEYYLPYEGYHPSNEPQSFFCVYRMPMITFNQYLYFGLVFALQPSMSPARAILFMDPSSDGVDWLGSIPPFADMDCRPDGNATAGTWSVVNGDLYSIPITAYGKIDYCWQVELLGIEMSWGP